jgi:hypothetical protein
VFVNASIGDLSAEFILDMGEDNIVNRTFSPVPKVACALGVGSLGPPGDDSLDQFIGRSANARSHLVACNTAERVDLFADRAGHARHSEVDARPDLFAREARGVNEKSDRCARTRMRVAHALGDRKERFLAGQGFPDDSREEARSSLIRFAGPHANRRQPDADTVKEAAPCEVGQQ